MIYLKSIVGSKVYNLSYDDSDTDIIIITDQKKDLIVSSQENKEHYIIISQVEKLKQFYNREELDKALQLFTPYFIFEHTKVQNFLINTSENWIQANKNKVFKSFYIDFKKIPNFIFSDLYKRFPKWTMKAARNLYILAEYGKTSNWKTSVYIPDDKRLDFYNIKMGLLSEEECYNKILNLQEQVEKYENFYSQKNNIYFNEYWFNTLCNLLDIDSKKLFKELGRLNDQ